MIDATATPATVLVLGAGSAIAQATVARLATNGTRQLLLAARHPEALDIWAKTLRARHPGLCTQTLQFDAVDLDLHPAFINHLRAAAPRIDLVLVAFGTLGNKDCPNQRDRAVEVALTNYVGAVSVLLPIADMLTGQGQGHIVVLSSVAAKRPNPTNPAYASSKAGLDSFAESLALALHGSGVDVTIVRPGFVATPMTEGLPAAPFATTADAVAADIISGLRRGSPVVWSPRAVQPLLAAARLLPRRMYRRLAATR